MIRKFYFIVMVCFVTVSVIGQTNPGDGLLFKQFENGIIKYRNNTQQEALLNYNTIEQEFLFLGSDNTVLALANPQDVDVITIGRRYFVPAEKDMFYEMLKTANTNFFVQWQSKLISQGKGAGYGGYSGTAAISNVSVHQTGGTSSGTGIHGRLISDEQFKANTDCVYYVIINGKYQKFNSLKSFTRLFKKHKEQIKTYSDQHQIDFSNPDTVATLVEFVYNL